MSKAYGKRMIPKAEVAWTILSLLDGTNYVADFVEVDGYEFTRKTTSNSDGLYYVKAQELNHIMQYNYYYIKYDSSDVRKIKFVPANNY